MLRTTTAASMQVSVAVVGAGLSGLRCADILLQYGCKVTVLEARSRIGGRVAQSCHLGTIVDLGPNWIHGTDHNPIMTIAQETETQLHSWDEEACIFDSDGNTLDDEETDQLNELLWEDGELAAAFRYSNEHHRSIDPDRSLHDFFVERAESMFTNESNDVAKRKRATFLQFAALWGSYIGSPVVRQSLKFFWLEECIQGENPFVATNYSKILDAVAKSAIEGAEIMLNTEVVKISGKHGGEDEEVQPSITTIDGPVLPFDEVVVTTPLGWLKSNKTAFEPPLPTRLSSAIDNISYGTLDKVYITFPSAFWETCTSNTDPQDDDEKSNHFANFIYWLQPRYSHATNPEQWYQECINLAALPPDSAHPTLLFYIQGPQSAHIGNLLKASKSDQERDAKLNEFFQPYYSQLPNYDESNPDCVPKALLATAWVNDRFAGYGSYCNFQVGLEKGDEDIDVMRKGMPERHVWLAGEHTAPYVALGTTTGAYWSGEAVANRIVEAYQLERKG